MPRSTQRQLAHGLLVVDGKILVLRRAPGRPSGGRWDIPGGAVAPGGSAARTVERRFHAETGLRVRADAELVRQPGAGIETVIYLVRPAGPTEPVALGPESDASAWIPPAGVFSSDVVPYVPLAVAAYQRRPGRR